MRFHVLTLFPEMIIGGLMHSVIKRGVERGLIEINCVNIRDFAGNKHNRVDDYPYGGGSGMVMQAEPVFCAYRSIGENARLVYLTPQGRPLTQKIATELASEDSLILLCGHYEGIDERVIEEIVTDEISVGDYILTGGELAAMTLIDCVSRLLPGVLNNEDSPVSESFTNGLLEYPQYTRPPVWRGKEVPEVLVSGHHGNVEKWRNKQSMTRTHAKRPDLLKRDTSFLERKEAKEL